MKQIEIGMIADWKEYRAGEKLEKSLMGTGPVSINAQRNIMANEKVPTSYISVHL